MSGPKHLWSGDWQRESEAATTARAQRAPSVPDPEPVEPEPVAPRPRRRLKRPRIPRTAVLAAVALLVLAGAALGFRSLLSSSPPRQGATAAPLPPPTTQPAVTSPPSNPGPAPRMVNWLGMLIATQPPGAAVVQTVALGTPADRAGISPGDVIVAINGRAIDGAQDIAAALQGLKAGDRVILQLAFGSGYSQAVLTLGAPPTNAP